MKLIRKTLCALLAAALLMPFALAAGTDSGAEKATLIVQLEDGSCVEQINTFRRLGGTVAEDSERNITKSILREQRRVQRDIFLKVDTDILFGYNYTAALNGFSMEADPADIPYIKKLDGVKNVYISQSHPLTDPKLKGEDLHADYSAIMTQITKLHGEGYRGEGTVIAIVDTEFDTNHEFLSGSVTNPRLSKSDISSAIANLELNADATANRVWKSDKIPFAYNYTNMDADTYNSDYNVVHGTHVAGIAAGKNGRLPDGSSFDGNAPEAQILCMAVPSLDDFTCIAAIDDAIKLGADALNLSWGSDYVETGSDGYGSLYQYVFQNALMSGMFIANSAGNSAMGTDMLNPRAEYFDYGTLGNPADNGLATTVASADSNIYWNRSLHIYVDGNEIGHAYNQNWDVYFNDTVDSENGLEYVMCGTDYDYTGDLTDKIAVFDMDSEDYSDARVLRTARAHGASAVIIIVPDDLYESYSVSYDEMLLMPVATVRHSDSGILEGGKRITSDLNPRPEIYNDNVTVSYFSSWGVLSSLNLDPNITAVGGNIWSSLPDDTYDFFSGTSMSSPQVAGTAAVLKEYLGKNEPSFKDIAPGRQVAEIENRMMSTAVTLYNNIPEENPTPFSPRLQGAGLLNAYAAAKTPVTLVGEDGRTRVQLRDKLTNDISFAFTAVNHTDRLVTYDSVTMDVFTNCVNEGNVVEYGQYLNTVSVSLPDSVTIPPNGTVRVNVSFSLDPVQVAQLENVFTNGFYVDGFVHLVSYTSDPSLVIPFMGFKGDWNGGPLLDHYGYLPDGFKLGSGDDCHSYTANYYMHRRDNCCTLGSNRLITDHYWDLSDVIDYDAVYNDAAFSAISPNGDSVFDYLCLSYIPLRNVDRSLFEIKDEDGNVLLSYDAGINDEGLLTRFLTRAHEFTYDELCRAGVNNEGKYIASITLWRNGTPDSDTMEIPFYVDNTAPVITKMTVKDNMLDIDMTDNRNLMALELLDADTGDWLMGIPFTGSDGVGTALDVSNWSDRNLKVRVSDYANNSTERLLSDTIGDLIGDVNGDGDISNSDLVMLTRYMVELEQFDEGQMARADFKPDGSIDNLDVVALARFLVNL